MSFGIAGHPSVLSDVMVVTEPNLSYTVAKFCNMVGAPTSILMPIVMPLVGVGDATE